MVVVVGAYWLSEGLFGQYQEKAQLLIEPLGMEEQQQEEEEKEQGSECVLTPCGCLSGEALSCQRRKRRCPSCGVAVRVNIMRVTECVCVCVYVYDPVCVCVCVCGGKKVPQPYVFMHVSMSCLLCCELWCRHFSKVTKGSRCG